MRRINLSDLVNINMGQSPPSETYNLNGEGLPFFQGKADFGEKYPTIRVFCNKPNKVAEPGDILISVRAPVGPINLTQEKACIGRGLAALRCNKEMNQTYLWYFLKHYEAVLASGGKGSTFDAINREDLETVQIPLPPLDEQKRIAQILDQADRLRRLRRHATQQTESLLQSVFIEMFGDPQFNTNNLPMMRIEEVVTVAQYGTSEKSNQDGVGYPVLGMANITYSGQLDLEKLSYIDLPEKEFRKLKLEPGDIIFNRTNSTELVGKTTVWRRSVDAVIASYLVKLKLDNTVVPEYFATLLNTAYFKNIFQKRCKKAVGQSNISPTLLKEFLIMVPAIEPQLHFAQVSHKIAYMLNKNKEAERQAELNFQTLLHQAFTGHLSRLPAMAN
jgi:type I restriction enzyme S subunit